MRNVGYKLKKKYITINLCKSAPVQIKPIPVIADLISYWEKRGIKEIIDIGCGKLRNSLILVKHFYLWISDFKDQFTSPKTQERLAVLTSNPNFRGIIYPDELKKGPLNVDAALLCFVLHTIPDVHLRKELVKSTISNLKTTGEIFVATPYGESYYKNKMSDDNKLKDGYIFHADQSQGTFYKEITREEIDKLFSEFNFTVVNTFRADRKILGCYSKGG